MPLHYHYALIPVAATIGWIAKSKSGVHSNSSRRTGIQRQSTQRRNDLWSLNTSLVILMSSSVSFLLGSHLTLLFTRNTSFTWAPDNANHNHMAYTAMDRQLPRVEHVHSNDGLLYEKRPEGKFPVGGKHIVAHGIPRTASTLLFNMVGVCNFLYLMRNEPQNTSYIEPKYIKFKSQLDQYLLQTNGTKIYKTHIELENFLRFDVVLFTTAKDKKEAATIKASLEEQGHDIAYVQDMQSLREGGIPHVAHDFAFGYGLSKEDEDDLVEYFSKWEILRQCCGQQMSQYWRNDLFPEIYRKVTIMKHHPFCADYDIDEMEKSFMETKLYSWIDAYPNMRPFNKPSLLDEELNGTYCSSYNELVKTQVLDFYGQPRRNENITTGEWTEEEHLIFLEGLRQGWLNHPLKIAKMLKTRTPMQVHLHLKDYILGALGKTPLSEDNEEEKME